VTVSIADFLERSLFSAKALEHSAIRRLGRRHYFAFANKVTTVGTPC
jgi:hypothetical protein